MMKGSGYISHQWNKLKFWMGIQVIKQYVDASNS